LAEQGEGPDNQGGHKDRLPRCPMALARLVTLSQSQEQGTAATGSMTTTRVTKL
jgi:hypothetical protein